MSAGLENAWPFVLLFVFCESFRSAGQAGIKGAGYQVLASVFTWVVYIGVGGSICYYLGFRRGWGLSGFFIGGSVAFVVECVGILALLYSIDWHMLMKEA